MLLLLRLLVCACEQAVDVPEAGALLLLQGDSFGLLQHLHGFVDVSQGQQRLPLQSQEPGDRLPSSTSGRTRDGGEQLLCDLHGLVWLSLRQRQFAPGTAHPTLVEIARALLTRQHDCERRLGAQRLMGEQICLGKRAGDLMDPKR